ncbi:polysaccharide biosynthesis tyrosine autokinase [Gordonia polyisoprenivorans]|nr:polysaccharide biosynthesis tyrosine autokinase [Gordonia polyisoprenivorans]
MAQAYIPTFVKGWWVIVVCALVGSVVAFAISEVQTRVYSSAATLYVTSSTDSNSQSAYQGSLASQQRVGSYSRLTTSDVILRDALSNFGGRISMDEARRELSSAPTPQTVLLTIRAKTDDPQKSASLVNAVSSSMVKYVRLLEKPDASSEPLAKLTVISYGTPSSDPVSPRIRFNFLLGAAGGLILGLCALFLWRRWDTRIRRLADLPHQVGNSVLGVISRDVSLGKRSLLDFSSGSSPASEDFRRLRANIGFVNVDSTVNTFLVTSSSPGDGKTTTALNVAAAFAEDGKSVVIVDADLRRPAVCAALGVRSLPGLTDCLKGVVGLDDVVQKTGTENLYCVSSGDTPPNPTELLGSERCADVISSLRLRFDVVVVDTPPVLGLADALVLSKWCDFALVVVRCDRTRKDELLATVDSFREAGDFDTRIVLNSIDPGRTLYSNYNRYADPGKSRSPS